MEDLIYSIKEMTDFFYPNYYRDYITHEEKPLANRLVQNHFYVLEHIQDKTFDLAWVEKRYNPFSQNYLEYLSLYEELNEGISLTDRQYYHTSLQEIKDFFGLWLKENIPENIPLQNALYGLSLLHFMRYKLHAFENHKDKMIIMAQQYCFLEEDALRKLWLVTDKMRPFLH